MKLKIGIAFGGKSVEHEVSIISAIQAIANMNKEKYDIVPLYLSKENIWYTGECLLHIDNYKDLDHLKKMAKEIVIGRIDNDVCLLSAKGMLNKVVDKIDVAFPIVHGQNVEDGTLAGFFESLDIPVVGSNVIGSAVGQDKVIMKQIFAAEDIPIVPYIWFFDTEYLIEEETYLKKIEKLGYPVIVKPASLGSSVGITFVSKKSEIKNAILEAIKYDNKIIVEKVIDNLTEVNCSVLGDYETQSTSAIEEVNSANSFLTYEDKYIGDKAKKGGSKGMLNTSRVIPARISQELTKQVEEISKKVFRALNLSGVCRIDFLINQKTKEVFVNEPNTIPGSLAFYLWEAKDKHYTTLLEDMIMLSIKDYKNKSKKTTYFDTNILENFNGTKGCKK